MNATAVLGTIVAGTVGILLNVFRSSLGPLFTVDGSVKRSVASLIPIVTVMLVGDAWICVFSGERASSKPYF